MSFYKLIFFFLFTLLVQIGQAQDPFLIFEEHAVHEGMVGESDLTGYKTWRLYIELANSNDQVYAVYSTPETGISLTIGNEFDFFQYVDGGFFAEDLNCLDTITSPEAAFDSYFTIGKSSSCDPGTAIVDTVLSPPFWIVDMEFQSGMNVGISDGLWKNEIGSPASFPDENNRVLLGQFTTEDDISISMNVEILLNGNIEDLFQLTDQIIHTGPPGCMDPMAINYDSLALADDGSCIYLGCTDSIACNFDSQANQDDASCDYSCLGCLDSLACNFDSTASVDDGSCIAAGCMDSVACNYDSETICDDNVTCTYAGCMESTADNYDSLAACDDGSCIFSGCMDTAADNYDSNANVDDGSCVYCGCTDSSASNYDSTVTCDDGSCLFPGCLDTLACNFDSSANDDNGTCTYPGCTDSAAENYNSSAGCDDGSCFYPCITDSLNVTWECVWNDISEEFDTGFNFFGIWEGECLITEICFTSSSPPLQYCIDPVLEGIELESNINTFIAVSWVIPGSIIITVGTDPGFTQEIELEVYNCIGGCTDPFADNYNSGANMNDGSCIYAPCPWNDVLLHLETALFASEIRWDISDESGNVLLESPPYLNETVYLDTLCIDDGCYSFNMYDSFGDGWNDANYELSSLGEIIASGTLEAGYSAFDFFSINDECPIDGCTDSLACNYNSLATVNDGTCIYSNTPCEETDPVISESLIGPFYQMVETSFELPLQNIDLTNKVEIIIYNCTGLEYLHKSYFINDVQADIPIDVSSLSKGIYWIKVINGSKKEVVNIGLY